MSNELRFTIRAWLERTGGTPPENSAFGELEIRAGDELLTEVEDRFSQTVRPGVRVSAVHLARWFAANWWRLRWEPRGNGPEWSLSHALGAAGGGFLWPFITIVSDGYGVALHARAGALGPSLRFLRDSHTVVSALSFERAVDAFLEAVLARLADTGQEDPDLSALWRTVLEERRDPNRSALRRREALLGLDPDDVDEDQLQSIFLSAAWMSQGASEEVFASARFERVRADLRQLEAWRDSPAAQVPLDLSAFNTLMRDWREDGLLGRPPWERGVALAQRVRRAFGVGAEPMDTRQWSAWMGADLSRVRVDVGKAGLGAVFLRQDADPAVGAVFRRARPTSLRFESARMIADALDRSPSDTVLPVTDSATARQKFQRAFAAELLCPWEAVSATLAEGQPSSEEIEDFAERYEVSERTVLSALVNHGALDRDALSFWEI